MTGLGIEHGMFLKLGLNERSNHGAIYAVDHLGVDTFRLYSCYRLCNNLRHSAGSSQFISYGFEECCLRNKAVALGEQGKNRSINTFLET